MKDNRFEKIVLPVFSAVLVVLFAFAVMITVYYLPVWATVPVIVALIALVAVIWWLFLDKVLFKCHDKTPDSASYFLVMLLISIWRKNRQTLHINREKLNGIDAPFVVLCNHVSFYDFYYVKELLKNHKPAYVVNHHITSAPVLRFLSKKAGMIPKKIFYPVNAGIKILRTLRSGYPVVVFPEGRLSIDGCPNPIVESAAAAYKKFGYPLVLLNISEGYFTYPKWRGKFYKGDVYISVERVLTSEDLNRMTVAEIEQAIEQALYYNASENPVNRFTQKDKATGLENVLYRCADCGGLYTTVSRGNDLYCTACKSVHHLDERYLFTDGIVDIPTYYDRIKAMERSELDDIQLETPVDVKVFSEGKPRVRKEKGVCTLNKDRFTYKSDQIEFTVPTEKLPALAFSCNSEFEMYYDNEQYYFYPVENRRQVARWALIVDLLREERIDSEKGEISD